MAAIGAVNVRRVGVIFLYRKAIAATLGTVEFDPHASRSYTVSGNALTSNVNRVPIGLPLATPAVCRLALTPPLS
jgi:hypothetical protein